MTARQKVNPAESEPRDQRAEQRRWQAPELCFSRPDAVVYMSLATLPQRASAPADTLLTMIPREVWHDCPLVLFKNGDQEDVLPRAVFELVHQHCLDALS